MKREKVTMKEIAKELNLSLATVSYVLNHSEKEKISHRTRMRVLETAKRMGYIPNQAAKAFAKNRSNLVGIIVNLSKYASTSMKLQALDLAAELQKQIYNVGFDTVLSVTQELEDIQIKYKHSLEAAFIIDVNENSLSRITKHYYVPLIFLDCDFNEGLFYKIHPDYESIIVEAKKKLEDEHPYLVMEQIINERIKEQIVQYFDKDDIFINRINPQSNAPATVKNSGSLKDFLAANVSRKGIIIGDLLAAQVERYIDNNDIVVISSSPAMDLLLPDTKRIIVSNQKKAEAAMNILMELMNLEYVEGSYTRILLSPDPPAELNL